MSAQQTDRQISQTALTKSAVTADLTRLVNRRCRSQRAKREAITRAATLPISSLKRLAVTKTKSFDAVAAAIDPEGTE